MELRLDPDPGGARPALAHGGGWALSHRGGAPASLAADLPRLAEAFRARAASTSPPIALREAVREVWPEATTERAGGALPRWPSTLRIGMPAPGAIWPFDAESVGLELGLRRLLKREQFSAAAAEADARWLASRGLAVSEPGAPDEDGRRVIFAAREPAALEEAEALEAMLRRADGSSAEAGRRIGEALGYPRCCVEAYAAVGARDDRGLAEALLPPLGSPPAPAETQWLDAPLGIVSHTPCSLRCEPTRRLAEALLEALDARAPGFADRWRHYARRVHLVGEARALALAVAHGRIRRVTELTLPEGEPLEGWVREVDEWVGRPLEAILPASPRPGRAPSVEVQGEVFLVADHRG